MYTVDQLSYTELLQIFILIKNTCKKFPRQEHMQHERMEPRGLALEASCMLAWSMSG
jgi:hypothetical protein